jgi:hypothetical protein
MMRSTIWDWVQRCTKCGYCAADIRKPCRIAREVINSQEYLDQLNDPIYPKLTNSFLCEGIIAREAKDYSAATWALIHAAWVCDDKKGRKNQASICRVKAAEMLVLAEQSGQQIVGEESDNIGGSTALLVDLLRRSGQMVKARNIVTAHRSTTSADIGYILAFQTTLIDKNDRTRHTTDEAICIAPLNP